MVLQEYKEKLLDAQRRLENNEIDEIPLSVRPKMPEFDFNTQSYVVVSYSRKDFVKVYLFLAYLYNEGYRFWYDNGMSGTKKWLKEYEDKYKNPNCLGTITFFSDNYISDSTKEELSLIHKGNGYIKRNVMVSLISLKEINVDTMLENAIVDKRISIKNAGELCAVLGPIIEEEKSKTIHRYAQDEDIQFLADKIAKDFNIRNAKEGENFGHGPVADTAVAISDADDFVVVNSTLLKYNGTNSHVVIPDGVYCIEDGVFKDCQTIEHLTLPLSLGVIGAHAFQNCSALKSLTIHKNVKRIGDQAFQSCTSLKTVTFEQSVYLASIGKEIFRECTALENLNLPDTIIRIGESAFRDCHSLVRLNLPRHLVEIGDGAFFRCCSVVGVSDLPNLTHLGKCAFGHCQSLVSMKLPDTITQIESGVFADCVSLINIDLPEQLTFVGNGAFSHCVALKEISLPETVTSIGAQAFRSCRSLSAINLPQSVSVIEPMTFSECHSLLDISIPDSITKIDFGAFSGCFNLTHINIPDSVIEINEEAFGYCYNLNTIILSKNLQYIGGKAFAKSGLQQIQYRGSHSNWKKVKKRPFWLGKRMRIICLGDIDD